jgi:3-hydroxyisobutyrate dehydrogenase
VGGDAVDVERARPALAAFSKAVVPTGALGTGTIVKLCNNLMGYLAWTAAFEGFALARAAGVPADVFEAVTRSGGHLTDAMAGFLGLHKMPDDARCADAHQARLRGFVELAEKDLAAALALARRHGIALPGAAMASQVMARVYGLEDAGRR